jgi:hypothetical protein
LAEIIVPRGGNRKEEIREKRLERDQREIREKRLERRD